MAELAPFPKRRSRKPYVVAVVLGTALSAFGPSQGVMGQLCCWSVQRFQHRERTSMQQTPLGLAHLRRDHLAHLVMAKEIASRGGMLSPAVLFTGLTQQSVSQDLIQRRQGLLIF